jgi:cobalt-zinc-cadmium efflux system membrane fusion protein
MLAVTRPTVALGQHGGHDHAHDESTHAAAQTHTDDDGHASHADEAEHTDHEGHATHDGHDDHGGLRIPAETLEEFGIVIQTAASGSLETSLQLSGEVVFNADRIAHVTPSVSGIAQSVSRSVGDRVGAGEVMAVLSSRDLASARSAYLAALANKELAAEMLTRDERLVADRIGTERQLLESQQALREAEIALKLAEYNLHALGEGHDAIRTLPDADDATFADYALKSPITGIVIERHLTRGELVSDQTDEPPFVIADLSSVWVNLTVYQSDLARVRPGQPVRIEFGHGIPDANGTVAFISPAIEERTRTATARVVLDNPEGHWRPGLFVAAYVSTEQSAASVIVPRTAVTEYEGETVVFVQGDEGFEPRAVRVGGSSEQQAEILSGLEPGERYVARNVLALKAELNRAELEHAGHVH